MSKKKRFSVRERRNLWAGKGSTGDTRSDPVVVMAENLEAAVSAFGDTLEGWDLDLCKKGEYSDFTFEEEDGTIHCLNIFCEEALTWDADVIGPTWGDW